jgi:nondiscriminating glutamyl-tRNA synthetase
MIYDAFGWNAPKFGHMSLIINSETGKKLSKRDESVLQFIEQYRDLGYLPDAMLNFIVLLGWSPVGEDEIFTRQEFIKMYDETRLSKSPAAFDGKKLEWINNQYMKQADEDRVFDLALPQLINAGLLEKHPSPEKLEWARKLISLFKREVSYAREMVEYTKPFFHGPDQINDEAREEISVDTALTVIKEFADRIEKLDYMDTVQILKTIKSIQKDTKIKGRKLWMPIRIAVTHEMHGPELPEAIELIGQEKTIANLKEMISELS